MLPRLVIFFALTLGLPSAAYQLRKDSTGAVVKWSGHVEFVLDARLAIHFGDSHTDSAVRAAIQTLDDATPELSVTVRVGNHQDVGYVNGAASNQNDIFILEDWPYDEKALAATIVTLRADTHEIVDADIVFNGQSHHFRVVDAMAKGEQNDHIDDIQNTLTHELGHALGLMHNPDDVKVVMYPSAAPLEISKRLLAQDDKDGLLNLYSTAPATALPGPEPIAGCNATGSSAFSLVALLALLVRRRAGLAVLTLLAPMSVLAADGADALDFTQVDQVSIAEVTAVSTVHVAEAPGLLFTDVTVTVRDCLKGRCEAQLTVRVPGGRQGNLEQVVAHQPVPVTHEQLVLVARPGASRQSVVRLHDPQHRQRVVDALTRAHLPVPVSLVPQASEGPRGTQLK